MIQSLVSLRRFMVAGLFFLSACLSAQTAEEVVGNYSQALGGADAWKKTQSVSLYGKILMQGMEMPTVIHAKRPDLFYQEISFMGKKILQATDGKKGWFVNPFMGSDKPQEMKPEEMAELKEGSQLDDELMFYREKGGQLAVAGNETVEGIPCVILDLTLPGNPKTRYFIDRELWLPVKQITAGPNGEEVEQWMSDYRPVDGKWMPFKMVQKIKGEVVSEVTIDKVEFEALKDDAIFAMPKP